MGVRPIKLTLITVLVLAAIPSTTGATAYNFDHFECSKDTKYCAAVLGNSHDPVLKLNANTNRKVVGCLRTSEAHWLCRSFKPVRTEGAPSDGASAYTVKRHLRSVYPYTGEGEYKMVWKRDDKKLMPGLKFWVD
jgi:hypothetical protein